ncbi:MAG: Yip1 family protein [Methanoregula sp.]
MKQSIINLLIRPGAFFQNAMNEKESLKFPVLVVLAGGIVGAMYGYLLGGLTGQLLNGILPGMGTIIVLSTVIGALIGTFIFWVIWAGVMYALSFVFKGEGTFRRTLEFIGYGYLPQVFGTLITFVIALDYIPRIHVPQLSAAAAQNPDLMTEAVKALMHDPAMMELSQIAMIISIVFLLWSANIWIFGMQQARKLSPRDAALCVGIPVVVYILYMVYSITVM